MRIKTSHVGIAAAVVAAAGMLAVVPNAVNAEPKPADPQPTASELEPGLAVRYYTRKFNHIRELLDWEDYKDGTEGPPITVLDYQVGTGDVLTSGKPDLVGARITGFIHLPDPGTYTFGVNSNDGVRVLLGGEQILNDPDVHGDRFSDPAWVTIEDGGWYPLTVLYFEKKNTSTLQLYWLMPTDEPGPMFIVPAENYAHSPTD